MEEVFDPGSVDQPDGTVAVDDLDRLAIVEAELSEAEAELDSMDNASVDKDPGSDL
ncbi:MAG TPA: hypothetical protein VMZ22_01235 [Acidimicrobiales bacterium]|nr:hypothetical protein [Acidimicrobiales bacterium]